MKRRNFIKGLMGLMAAPVVAKAAQRPPLETGTTQRSMKIPESQVIKEEDDFIDFPHHEVHAAKEGGFIAQSGTRANFATEKSLEQAIKDIEAMKEDRGLMLAIKPKYLRFYS